MTTTPPGPLPFGINQGNHRDYSESYGRSYWAIGLPDGREVYLHADRLEVSPSGALTAWCETKVTKRDSDGDIVEREPATRPEALLGLAVGAWVHFYAASVLTGDPVMISALPELAKAAAR